MNGIADRGRVHLAGKDRKACSRTSHGRRVEELVGGLGEAQLGDSHPEGGEHRPRSAVGSHDGTGWKDQRLRDVALEDDMGGLGTEGCGIAVGPDGHHQPDWKLADTGQRGPEGLIVVEHCAEGQVHQRVLRAVEDMWWENPVRCVVERNGSQGLAGTYVLASRRLKAGRVDVEVEVVVGASVGAGVQTLRPPQGLQLL